MSDNDAFFTLSIVGARQKVLMGRRMRPADAQTEGLRVAMGAGESRLSQFWHESVLLATGRDTDGVPRPQPGAVRRWLERNALWIAALGLCALAASAAFWGLQWQR
jgi:hypothetical protein